MTSSYDENWEYLISYQRKKLSLYNKDHSYHNLDFNQVERVDKEAPVYKLIGPEAEIYLERICESHCLIQLWVLELSLYPHRSRQGLMFLDLLGWSNSIWQWMPFHHEKANKLRELANTSYYIKNDWYRYK